jgi:hypothetical protein
MRLTDPPEKAFGSNIATPRDAATGRFLDGPGGSSRRGRKKGARARWAEDFMAVIEQKWREHGEALVDRAMFLDPVSTLRALVTILPREAKLEIATPTDSLSDERLEQLLAYAEARVAEMQTIEGVAVDVTPKALAAPAPFDGAPTLKAEQERETLRADLHAQHERIIAVGAVRQAFPSIPHPVGKPFPATDHDVERRNLAKLHDDIDPVDPDSLF